MRFDRFFFASAILLLAMASCQNKEEDIDGGLIRGGGEIAFIAGGEGLSFDVVSKATSVTSLTEFNVNCVTGTLGSAETSKFNTAFTKDGVVFKGGQYWPSTNGNYKFYASNVAITPASSGATVAATNATDVVCAVLPSPTFGSTNELTFNHIFAQVGKVSLTAPGYTVSNLSIKITPKTGGTYNLFTGNGKTDGTGWTGVNTGSEVTLKTDGTSNVLYLVPGQYTLTATFTLTLGAYSETFSKTATVNVVGGKVNDITGTADGNAALITFSVNVTPWGTNNINASF